MNYTFPSLPCQALKVTGHKRANMKPMQVYGCFGDLSTFQSNILCLQNTILRENLVKFTERLQS